MAYHDFEGPVTTGDEKVSLLADLGNKDLLILRNHGLLAGGRTIAEAFFNMYIFEAACKIQVDALAMGRPLRMPSQEALDVTYEFMAGIRPAPRGNLEWASLRRRVDRLLPGYEN